MYIDIFRQFFGYHMAENRKLWDRYITALTLDQFTQESSYSHGSVRNQIVHLMEVDEGWFTELRGTDFPEPFPPANGDDRDAIRSRWDQVEQEMREYLAILRDEMLFQKPITAVEEDKDLTVWQVLLHVANHGTDHRAQILRQLNDLGVETGPQDYIFYIYEHL